LDGSRSLHLLRVLHAEPSPEDEHDGGERRPEVCDL
jgi:hypothetical protein